MMRIWNKLTLDVRRLTAGTKLYVLVGLAFLLVSLGVGISLIQVNLIGKEANSTAKEDVSLTRVMNRIRVSQLRQAECLSRAMCSGRRMGQDDAEGYSYELERARFQELCRGVEQQIQEGKSIVEQGEDLAYVDYELRELQGEHALYALSGEHILNLIAEDKIEKAEAATRRILGNENALHAALENFSTEIAILAIDSAIKTRKSGHVALAGMLSVSASVLLLGLFLGGYISRSTKRPITELTNATSSLPLHVLVIDDEALVCETLTEYLAADGHTAVSASNGIEGLQKFKQDAFDLVITDMAMPGMDGAGLATGIKEIAPDIPVILLTGFSELAENIGGEKITVDRVLSKPLDYRTLQQVIKNAVDERAQKPEKCSAAASGFTLSSSQAARKKT